MFLFWCVCVIIVCVGWVNSSESHLRQFLFMLKKILNGHPIEDRRNNCLHNFTEHFLQMRSHFYREQFPICIYSSINRMGNEWTGRITFEFNWIILKMCSSINICNIYIMLFTAFDYITVEHLIDRNISYRKFDRKKWRKIQFIIIFFWNWDSSTTYLFAILVSVKPDPGKSISNNLRAMSNVAIEIMSDTE